MKISFFSFRSPEMVVWIAVGFFFIAFRNTLPAQKAEIPQRTEVFHVGRVGVRGAAESRDTLMSLYEEVSREYNAKLKAEQKSNPQRFKGDRVRILRKLQGKRLFMVAYNGGPSVFEVSGDVGNFKPGTLSPALQIGDQVGKHEVEVTRVITITDAQEPEPQLETVEQDDEPVTFFGIPIPGTSQKSGGGNGKSKGAGKGKGGARKQEVTETKDLPKFSATVSTERLDGGTGQMSTQLFVSQLKNGEVFSVQRNELRRCQRCRGFGRIATTKPPGFRDPDGKMECPECQSKGKIQWDVTYRVTW